MLTESHTSDSQQICKSCANHSHTVEDISQIRLPRLEMKMAHTPARLQASLLLATSHDCQALFQTYLLKHSEDWSLDGIVEQAHFDQVIIDRARVSTDYTSSILPLREQQSTLQSAQTRAVIGVETVVDRKQVRRSRFHEHLDEPMGPIDESLLSFFTPASQSCMGEVVKTKWPLALLVIWEKCKGWVL